MGSGAQPSTDSSETRSRAYSLVSITPQPFDKYTLIGKLGHGGMAEVNLAVVEGKGNFRKLVVIKRLHQHLAMEPGFIDMFLDEARLAARLNHPHCVQTHEVGEYGGNHFLAMEYLDGQGLERLLRISGQKGEPIPIDLAARIVSDALDGLAYAHELTDFDGTPLGVVHRDVSPQNIFITYNGMVKLLDFGIAKAATHVVETRTGVIKGKYAYIAPEQALAQEVDHRADLWSMGVVLWEVLTGRRLFKSVNELATLHETLQGEVKRPSTFRPDLPPVLDDICMRALQRSPIERYQSAQEMKEDLDRWLATLPKAPGRKHIARLMRERFDEVIEAHKQMLAMCLKGGSIGASGVHQLMDPMVTPSGMSPISVSGVGPSITPTPSPSGAHTGAVAVPANPAPQPASSGIAWKIAVVVLVMALAGVSAFLLPFGGDDPAGEPVATATQAGQAEPEPPEEPVEEPTVAREAQPPESAPEQAAEAEPEPAPEPDPTAASEADEPEPERTASRRHRSDRSRRRQHRPEPPPETREPAHEEPAPSAAEAPGYLTLATTPWARVRLGSRDLGTTPLIRVELPPGTHTLHLSNPEQNIEEAYRVTIRSGETVTRRLGLR